jgi:hypothetical protein
MAVTLAITSPICINISLDLYYQVVRNFIAASFFDLHTQGALVMSKSSRLALLLLPVLLGGTVLLNGCASTPTQESTGQVVDSSAITAEIKSKFIADSEISSLSISVETFKDRVTLSGYVDNKHQRRKAVDIAEHTNGVKSVRDELVIRHHRHHR